MNCLADGSLWFVPSWVEQGRRESCCFLSVHPSGVCALLGGQAGAVPAGTTGSEEMLVHRELLQRAQVSGELIMK